MRPQRSRHDADHPRTTHAHAAQIPQATQPAGKLHHHDQAQHVAGERREERAAGWEQVHGRRKYCDRPAAGWPVRTQNGVHPCQKALRRASSPRRGAGMPNPARGGAVISCAACACACAGASAHKASATTQGANTRVDLLTAFPILHTECVTRLLGWAPGGSSGRRCRERKSVSGELRSDWKNAARCDFLCGTRTREREQSCRVARGKWSCCLVACGHAMADGAVDARRTPPTHNRRRRSHGSAAMTAPAGRPSRAMGSCTPMFHPPPHFMTGVSQAIVPFPLLMGRVPLPPPPSLPPPQASGPALTPNRQAPLRAATLPPPLPPPRGTGPSASGSTPQREHSRLVPLQARHVRQDAPHAAANGHAAPAPAPAATPPRPAASMPPPAPPTAPMPSPWIELKTASGRVYLHNTLTCEDRWLATATPAVPPEPTQRSGAEQDDGPSGVPVHHNPADASHQPSRSTCTPHQHAQEPRDLGLDASAASGAEGAVVRAQDLAKDCHRSLPTISRLLHSENLSRQTATAVGAAATAASAAANAQDLPASAKPHPASVAAGWVARLALQRCLKRRILWPLCQLLLLLAWLTIALHSVAGTYAAARLARPTSLPLSLTPVARCGACTGSSSCIVWAALL